MVIIKLYFCFTAVYFIGKYLLCIYIFYFNKNYYYENKCIALHGDR